MFDDEFTYDQDEPELDENGLIMEDDDDYDYDNDDDDEDDDDEDDDSEEESAKDRRKKLRSKHVDKHIKKLDKDIHGIFMRPESKIPTDISDSVKKSAKSIPETTKEIFADEELKPTDKAIASAEVAKRTVKTSTKKIGDETTGKLVREGLKKVIEMTAPYSYAAIAIVCAIVVILVIGLAIMVALSGATSGAAGATEPENMTESFAIKSDYFYGTRSIYIDEAALINSLQSSYKQYVSDVIVEIENQGIDVKIEIITIDEETQQPNQLTNESNSHYNSLSVRIGNSIANKNETNFNNVIYEAIPYFGLTETEQSTVNNLIVNYIKNNSLYQLITAENFPNDLAEQLNGISSLEYIKNRCEKVMIKDEIATDTGIVGIEQRNYIASIYMPNKDLLIIANSVCVATEHSDDVINFASFIHQSSGDTMLESAQTLDDGKNLIDPIDGVITPVSAFTAINTENIEAFKNGVCLLDIIRQTSASLFQQNEDGVYTWKPNIDSFLYLTFSGNNEPFIFTDLRMDMAEAS